MATVGDLYDLQRLKESVDYDHEHERMFFNDFLNAAWYGNPTQIQVDGMLDDAADLVCRSIYQYFILMIEHPEWFDSEIDVLIRTDTDEMSNIMIEYICKYLKERGGPER